MLESLPEPLKEPLLEPWHEPCSPGFQVARSWGKVPSLRQDPKDADFQGSRIYSRWKGSKILRFQGSKVPGFIVHGDTPSTEVLTQLGGLQAPIGFEARSQIWSCSFRTAVLRWTRRESHRYKQRVRNVKSITISTRPLRTILESLSL